jgi:hypothetical protein
MDEFENGAHHLTMSDPRKEWATARSAAPSVLIDPHGMQE